MRTEEEKIACAPVKVLLGGEEYEIRPLTLAESRVWKKEAQLILSKGYEQINTKDTDKFGEAFFSFMFDSSDRLLDLFFSYAKELNRESIEKIATEKEVAVAWEKVREVAFPLAQTLIQTMSKMLP